MTTVSLEEFLSAVREELADDHPCKQSLSPYTFLQDLHGDREQRAQLCVAAGERLGFRATGQQVLDMLHSIPRGNLSDMFLAFRTQRMEREYAKKNKRWWYGSLVLAALSAYMFVETYYFGAILIGYVFVGMREYLRGGQ